MSKPAETSAAQLSRNDLALSGGKKHAKDLGGWLPLVGHQLHHWRVGVGVHIVYGHV